MIPELFWFYISQKFFLAKFPKINSLLLFLHFERNKKTWRTSCECASCGTRSDIWFHGNKLIISKADNGLLCLLILRLIFCESLLSCDKGGIPFRKVWILKLKISQKFFVMKIFSRESFSHFNIMYLPDTGKVYYDSDNSDYNDEKLYNKIYSGIWNVN